LHADIVGLFQVLDVQGRNIFRPHIRGVGANWARATICSVAMFDGWAIAHGWRTDGRKIFRPYTCGSWLHWARTTNHGAAIVDTRAIAYGWRT
jgi:hypothetical protein